MPATQPSFPPVGVFLMLAPTWWVWMSHLLPTGAGRGWTPYHSLPLEVIRLGTVSLFSEGDLVPGSC